MPRPSVTDFQPGRFVGRQRELAELQAASGRLREEGGRLFLLCGDPGIGKTRLASQLAGSAAATGTAVVWGRCSEEGGAPAYWPWMQILRRLRALPATAALVAPTPADVERLAPLTAESDATEPSAALGHEPAAARFALFDAVVGCLRRVTTAQPLLLVFDDLHAADRPSLLMLKFVAAEVRDLPLLLLGTYRRLEVERQAELAALIADIGRAGKSIPVPGLSRPEVAQLTADVCTATLPETLVEDIWQRTEGNPFFVDEIARMLTARHDEPLPAHLPEALPLSIGLRETLRVRLRSLSEPARRLLSIAAVFGREFDATALAQVAALTLPAVQATLAEGIDAGLIRSLGATGYSFTHALMRDAVEADCDRESAAEWHRAAAQWLETSGSAPSDGGAAEIARHYFAAGGPADIERAVQFAVRAAAAAANRLAYEEAARHYGRALQFVEAQRPVDLLRRCELTLAVAEMLRAYSDPDATLTLERAVRQARELLSAGQARGAELLARAALKTAERGLGMPHLATDPAVVTLLQEAMAAVGEADSPWRARLLGRLAVELAHSEAGDRCEVISRDAVDMARRLDDAATLGVTLSCRQFVCWRIAHILDGLATSTEIVQLGAAIGDKELELQGRTWRLVDLFGLGEIATFDAEVGAQVQAAEALRQPRYLWMAACLRGGRALWRGDWPQALACAEKALQVGERTGDAQSVISPGMLNFVVRRELGELAAEEMRLRMLAEAVRTSPVPRTLLGIVLMELDRRDEAREQFECVAAENFENLRHERRLGVLPYLCELALYLDDRPRAELLEPLVRPYLETTLPYGVVVNFGSSALYLALLDRVLDREADAVAHFDKAIAFHERASAPALLARTRFEYARFLASRPRLARSARALELAGQASAAATALGMPRLASLCGPLLDGLRNADAASSQRAELRATGSGTGPLAAADPPRGKLHVLPARQSRRREPEPPSPPVASRASFRRDGEYWSIGDATQTVRLKDIKGLSYLARLLAEPEREFHVTELVLEVEPPPATPGRADDGAATQGLHQRSARSDSGLGAPLDAQAKAAYRQRLRDLREQLSEAEEFNDVERASRLRAEIEFLARELSRAVGLHGSDRPIAAQAEKARLNVTRAIKSAIDRLKRQHPHLGVYLETTVRTGAFCVYRPDPRFPIQWAL